MRPAQHSVPQDVGHSMARVAARPGFTLIELMIVITIVGLLAGMASLRMTGLTSQARFQQAIERLETLDAAMRSRAVRFKEPAQLELEIGKPFIRRSFGDRGEEERGNILTGSVEFSCLRTFAQRVSSGRLTLHYSAIGSSETYAIELSAPGQETVWLLFSGRTGQMTQWERERDVAKILETLRTDRNDAG